MAVSKSPISASLRLIAQTGTNAKGEPLFQNRDFKGLKPSATDDNVYAAAEALSGLMSIPVSRIARVDTNQLIEA
ncbi:conserved hypothetical protein [Heliomicrobium modesticaldum Ice1]|uniref:DUF1659 domain-containing protein n=1 Tax=Heliobacterium modesticaldum (strain ATCC 51547 / Ice1) TaxID=498761 RepID=B0TDP3_HELMI|nr:DUF1659 domain-containing protein [Heliomicrobium modesticaldum]ABZ85568.1 conserved hypothetical protein [Heliomicrobium modesticaldum Ice1]